MFGSLLKGISFLTVVGLCAAGAIYLAGISGNIVLHINTRELSLSIFMATCVVIGLFVCFLIMFAAINFIGAVFRFLSGDETAITRYFIKSRENKGNKALSKALISYYEGDSVEALSQSNKAKNLLKNSSLSLLINAQIAHQTGNSKLALVNYKKLLLEKDTRLVALTGIISEKIKEGDYEAALTLSRKSVQLNPTNINNTNTLFNLQVQEGDWAGGRETLSAKKKQKKITHKVFLRQEAMLIFEDAKEKRSQGLTKEALNGTLEAVRKYPSFVPALSFLTELELMSGKKQRVEKLLQKGWSLFPHPDIAKSYGSLVQKESAEDRKARFDSLIKIKGSSLPGKILQIELNLAVKDYVAAKKLISKLLDDYSDNYVLTLMAAVEKGSGSDDSIVRGWLTKAAYASKPFTWICNKCGFQTAWVCVCPQCKSFDTIEWQRPPPPSEQIDKQISIPMILTSENSDENETQGEFSKSESAGKADNIIENIDIGQKNKQEEKLEIDTVKKAREIS